MSEPVDRRRRSREKAWKLSTGDDLEDALRAAERLLAQSEERRRHQQNRLLGLYSAIAGTTLTLFGSLIVVVEIATFGDVARVGAGILSLSATVAILILMFRAVYQHRRLLEFESSAVLASRIASLITEAINDVAEREEWSYLRIEATRLRLAAFPLVDRSGRPSSSDAW